MSETKTLKQQGYR